MPLKTSLAAVAALTALAADLHASGAVRTEQNEKFGLLRTGLDQLADSLNQAEAASAAPASPDAAAFAALAEKVEAFGHQLETVAVIVDHTGDQVAALTASKG